jgi:hypothetical protein
VLSSWLRNDGFCAFFGFFGPSDFLARLLHSMPPMRGFITEQHLGAAETCFPGIGVLYKILTDKPATFLDLVWEYRRSCGDTVLTEATMRLEALAANDATGYGTP